MDTRFRPDPEFAPEELATLRRVTNELDMLHDSDETRLNRTVENGEHYILSGYIEFIATSINPERSRELFHQIHQVFRPYYIPVNVYKRLGEAHEELRIKPLTKEFARAIKVATERDNLPRYNPWEAERRICPQKMEEERHSSKEAK